MTEPQPPKQDHEPATEACAKANRISEEFFQHRRKAQKQKPLTPIQKRMQSGSA